MGWVPTWVFHIPYGKKDLHFLMGMDLFEKGHHGALGSAPLSRYIEYLHIGKLILKGTIKLHKTTHITYIRLYRYIIIYTNYITKFSTQINPFFFCMLIKRLMTKIHT